MAPEVQDYYALLGISRSASSEEIHRAFRRLARQYHPDLVPGDSVAEEKFKEINEAYEVLSDPETRNQYDHGERRCHRRWQKGRCPSANRKVNFRPSAEKPEFHSLYEQVFGKQRRETNGCSTGEGNNSSNGVNGSRRRGQHARRGDDVQVDVWISLEEVLRGSIHTVSLLRHSPLTGCPERRALHVKIPPGVRQGQTFWLPGKGDYGIADGEPGDLFLRVNLAVHPDLQVNGCDLCCDLNLTPWEAFFGAKKTIPTLEGLLVLNVPAGTRNRQRLRLRGKGLPNGDGSRGDLYSVVFVKVPFTDILRRILHRG